MTSGRARWPHRLLGATFIGAGAMHFVIPDTYESIVPGYLPAHRELVYASGVAEMMGGLGALDARTRRLAGWWLTATLLAVLPANVHMALHPDRYASIPQWALYVRLPVQGLFIAWSLWATRPAR